MTKHNLSKLEDAVRTIHFPKDLSLVEKARFRFSYEEILLKRLASLKIKEEWNKKLTAHQFEIEKHRKKIDNLIQKKKKKKQQKPTHKKNHKQDQSI